MSRTRNPFQLIEGLHGGLFDSLAAIEEDELLYPESEGFDYGNIATSKKLRYSNTYEIPDRNVVLERADINSNGLMLMLNAGSPDPAASLRVVAINNQKIFESLDFDLELSPIQREIFFPVDRKNYNKKFPSDIRVTDTLLKRGMNKISFKDYEIGDHLFLFFIFYYEANDEFQIYLQELLIEDSIMDSEIVVDQRVPQKQQFVFDYAPSTERKLYLDYLTKKQQKALFSRFYNTVDTKNNLRFLFAFDIGRHLRRHTQFPELLQHLDLVDFIQSYEVERYWQGRSVGFMMKNNRYPKTMSLNIINNAASTDGIIFFGGVDTNVGKGLYTYSANIVIKDMTIEEAEDRMLQLRDIERNILELEDMTTADDENIINLINLFPADFLFLAERANSHSRLSGELMGKITNVIHLKIKDIERRLALKETVRSVVDVSGDSLLRTFAYNGEDSARRLTTLHHEFPTVEYKKYRNMGMGLTLDDELSFKKIKHADIKEYITIYKEEQKSLIINKEPKLKSIQSFTEFNNTYDDYKSGSFHVGLKQPKDHKAREKISRYMINISKTVHECKIEYLANYKMSNIDEETSIHSENWIEIKNENDIKQLPRASTMLFRLKTPEPIYDKYFFAKND